MATSRPYGLVLGSLIALTAACATTGSADHVQAPAVPYGQGAAGVKANTPAGMSLARIERYLQSKGSNMQSPRPGVWHLSVDGVIVLTIVERDRIRVIAPIFSLEQLDGELGVQHALLRRLLQANFDQSADARYAIFDGIVFATITHARNALHESDLERFVNQVVNLHKNTFRTGRTGYSSETPDPNSEEIDPRRDGTLEVPEGYERYFLPSPRPMVGGRDRTTL
jgi:hypothetical protein